MGTVTAAATTSPGIWDLGFFFGIGKLLPGEYDGSAFSLYVLQRSTSLEYLANSSLFQFLVLEAVVLAAIMWFVARKTFLFFPLMAISVAFTVVTAIHLTEMTRGSSVVLMSLESPHVKHNLYGYGCIQDVWTETKAECIDISDSAIAKSANPSLLKKARNLAVDVTAILVKERCLVNSEPGTAVRCLEQSGAPYTTIWDVVAAVEPRLPSCTPMGSTESHVNAAIRVQTDTFQKLKAQFGDKRTEYIGARVSQYAQFVCVSPTGGVIETVDSSKLSEWMVGKLKALPDPQ